MAADLLSTIADELDARLSELCPLVAEYESLLVAAAALEGAGEDASVADRSGPAQASASTAAAPRRRRGRPPGKRSSVGSANRSTPASPPAPSPSESAPSESAPDPSASAPDEQARAVSQPVSRRRPGAPKRAQRGAAAVAILAALEHGSHTVSELAVVTAMGSAIINNNLRRLQEAGTITRAKREGDGKAAYALTATSV